MITKEVTQTLEMNKVDKEIERFKQMPEAELVKEIRQELTVISNSWERLAKAVYAADMRGVDLQVGLSPRLKSYLIRIALAECFLF